MMGECVMVVVCILCSCDSTECEYGVGVGVNTTMMSETVEVISEWMSCVYYETITRELNKRLIYECRCDERLKAKAEGSTCLSYTLKTRTRNECQCDERLKTKAEESTRLAYTGGSGFLGLLKKIQEKQKGIGS